MNAEQQRIVRKHAKDAIYAWRTSAKNVAMPGLWAGLGDWNAKRCAELGGFKESQTLRKALIGVRDKHAPWEKGLHRKRYNY